MEREFLLQVSLIHEKRKENLLQNSSYQKSIWNLKKLSFVYNMKKNSFV